MNGWCTRQCGAIAALRRRFGPVDWLLLLRIFGFAAAVPALMRLRLPRLEALLRRPPASPEVLPRRVEQIVTYVDAVQRRGRPLVRRGCLTRGLTLYYFLGRAGLEVTLVFGVGTMNGEYAGHCWLVRNGEPFLEKTDPRPHFTELYAIPHDPGFRSAGGRLERQGEAHP